jgi:hypothetical protein
MDGDDWDLQLQQRICFGCQCHLRLMPVCRVRDHFRRLSVAFQATGFQPVVVDLLIGYWSVVSSPQIQRFDKVCGEELRGLLPTDVSTEVLICQ